MVIETVTYFWYNSDTVFKVFLSLLLLTVVKKQLLISKWGAVGCGFKSHPPAQFMQGVAQLGESGSI